MQWTTSRTRDGRRVALGLACLAVVIGCTDDPAPVADDTPVGEATVTSVPSLVGRVWIGAPVRNGRVEVFAYDGLIRGQGFGETITNEDRRFALPTPDYSGRVVFRISGPTAAFPNPASGEFDSFGDSDELFATTVLGPSLTGTELQVDVLTTLVTTHALTLCDTEGPDRAGRRPVVPDDDHLRSPGQASNAPAVRSPERRPPRLALTSLSTQRRPIAELPVGPMASLRPVELDDGLGKLASRHHRRRHGAQALPRTDVDEPEEDGVFVGGDEAPFVEQLDHALNDSVRIRAPAGWYFTLQCGRHRRQRDGSAGAR